MDLDLWVPLVTETNSGALTFYTNLVQFEIFIRIWTTSEVEIRASCDRLLQYRPGAFISYDSLRARA
jgi:hypothetical protein